MGQDLDRLVSQLRLRLTLGKMEAALNTVSDGIVWTDRQGFVQWGNAAFADLVNCSYSQMPGRSLMELLPLSQNYRLLSLLEHPLALASLNPLPPTEYEFTQGDHTIYLEISGNSFSIQDQEQTIVLVFHEIGRRKETEKALRFAQFALEHNSANIIYGDATGRILYANEAAAKTLGYSKEELFSRSIFDVDSNLSSQSWAGYWQALKEQRSRQFETTFLTKNGAIIPVEVTVNYLLFDHREYIFSFFHDITRRQQVESALQHNEQKYRNIFKNTQVGIFRGRIEDGLILEANQYFLEMMGYTESTDVIGKLAAIDIYNDPQERIKILEYLEQEGEIEKYELSYRTRDGYIHSGLFSLKLNREENCIEGVVTDITELQIALQEREQTQEALAKSLALQRAILESIADGILAVDNGGHILSTNQQFLEMWGLTQSMLEESDRRQRLAMLADQLVDPDTFLKQLQEIYRQPEAKIRDVLELKDGRVFERTSQPQRVGAKIVGRVWTFRDITERRKAEEALKEKEAYLRMILDNIPQQVFWKDANLVFRGCNRNWANYAQIANPDDVVGLTDYDLVPPEMAEQFRAADRQIMEADTPLLHIVAKKVKPGEHGEVIWLDINKIPMHDADGKIIGVLGVLEDITQRKVAEDSLKEEQARSEELLLNILPAAIASKLKQRTSIIAEHFNQVTILFADIVGFTPIAERLPPIELVNLLNHIFSCFDELAEYLGLEKIKTIGDAYMVAAGLPIPQDNHAEAIADMAIAMQAALEMLEWERGETYQIRIGINTGSAVAGVIGTKKFIYDLWGDAVNVASRMESSGEPNEIQVTESTYQILKDKYEFQARGSISIKGKGEMNTYWLKGRKIETD